MNAIVIAGASVAGIAAAKTLRKEGFAGAITLVDPESVLPYDRTMLSKDLLLGRVDVDELSLLDEEDLGLMGLRWRRGTHVTELDDDARRVRLGDGSWLPFDGLVIATGSSPRPLPLGHTPGRGVHELRTLGDAITLRAALCSARKVMIVGGGFIGLEVAAAAVELGVAATVLEIGDAPLAQVLGAEVGMAIARRHQLRGVEILTRASATAWIGDGSVEGLQLADGRRVAGDLGLVGVGVVPNTAWLAGSRLASQDGVQCEPTLATSVAGIVAAGDVARWRHPLADREIRIEHFEHAELSGSHAARCLLAEGDIAPYAPVPFVWSHQGPHTVHVAGFPSPHAEVEVVEGDLEVGPFAATYREDGRTVGVLTFDLPRTFRRLRRDLQPQGVTV